MVKLYWEYIGIMEKTMETAILGLGFGVGSMSLRLASGSRHEKHGNCTDHNLGLEGAVGM